MKINDRPELPMPAAADPMLAPKKQGARSPAVAPPADSMAEHDAAQAEVTKSRA